MKILKSLFLLFFLSYQSQYLFSAEFYLTESQLKTLEEILKQQSELVTKQEKELATLNVQLNKSLEESKTLKNQLNESQELIENLKEDLSNANKSLKKSKVKKFLTNTILSCAFASIGVGLGVFISR